MHKVVERDLVQRRISIRPIELKSFQAFSLHLKNVVVALPAPPVYRSGTVAILDFRQDTSLQNGALSDARRAIQDRQVSTDQVIGDELNIFGSPVEILAVGFRKRPESDIGTFDRLAVRHV